MTTFGYMASPRYFNISRNGYINYFTYVKCVQNIKHQIVRTKYKNLLQKVAVSRLGLPILGTGSADQTAKVGDNDDDDEDDDNDDHDDRNDHDAGQSRCSW